jgi:hypothetical protein
MATHNTVRSSAIYVSDINNESLLTKYQDKDCWLCWRYEEYEDDEKPRKVPVDPNTETSSGRNRLGGMDRL